MKPLKFKLDECLDVRLFSLFIEAGHQADTVFSENISGVDDQTIYRICKQEGRTLITQDLDFSNPFIYSPKGTKGIIVLRNPTQLLDDARALMAIVIERLEIEEPDNHLWVVGYRGIRIWPA
jgi:predicted nuclease of predicted toxin-antitoxin system